MKNTTHQFALIDSTYSAYDAREVITSLINDKIRFLNVQILSLQERYGQNTEHLENRVRELEVNRREMIDLLTKATTEDALVEVSSLVNVTVKQSVDIDA
jgi:hypothetical protein